MTDLLSLEFMRNALLAAAFVGLAAPSWGFSWCNDDYPWSATAWGTWRWLV
nr:hypothetical protein [Ornithinimicrobium sp. INDO-MA30-4]